MSHKTLTLEPGGALRSPLVARMLDEALPGIRIGTRIGPFRIVEEIGQGGLGVVYLADRDGDFEQRVALKVIAPEAHRQTAETLLAHERRLLARLQHPDIARLIDGGRSDDGLLWFAMEHVEGERIDHWCDRHAPDWRTRLRLVRRVCDAIAYAHARRVVHRDIKPSNILVDAEGRPRLLDFGIAAALDDSGHDPAQGAATPGYASPEQRRGETPGVAQDVYQIGRLLEKLVAPPERAPEQADLRSIIARATADDPARRYASIDALNTDLGALLEHRPISTRADTGAFYRLRLLIRRHRIASVATTLVLLAMIGTVAYFLTSLNQARIKADHQAAVAGQMVKFMTEVFSSADPLLHGGEIPRVDAVLDHASQRLNQELLDQPEVRRQLLSTLGRVFITLRDYHRAKPLLAEAVGMVRAAPDLPASERATTIALFALAGPDHESGGSVALYDEALALLDIERPEHGPQAHGLMLNRAAALSSQGKSRSAIASMNQALAYADRMLGTNNVNTAPDRIVLAELLREQGDLDASLASIRAAREIIARAGWADDHPYTIICDGELAVSLALSGVADEARTARDRALANAVKVYGHDSPNHMLALLKAAHASRAIGEADQSHRYIDDGLAIAGRLKSGNDVVSVDLLELRGDLQLADGDPAAAEASYRAMLDRNRDGNHAQRPDVGQRPLKLARALVAQGRCDGVDDLLRTARERLHASEEVRLGADLDAVADACRNPATQAPAGNR